MTLILDRGLTKGAHALVIGVGDYPWLGNGTKPLFAHHEGMGQLSSPPASARGMADWLLAEFDRAPNPLFRLSSVELLISDAKTDRYVDPGNVTHTIGRADFAAIDAAVQSWYRRGDSDPDNLLLFYFCGHGIARGVKTTLLPEDYGSQTPAHRSVACAVDFDELHLGMDSCKARQQLYFVDACRVASGQLMRMHNSTGSAIIPGLATVSSPARNAPVYYGTMAGTRAFGRSGKPSFFTEALLKALRGAGADDTTGSWAVQTDCLHRGVTHHLKRAVANTAAAGQLSSANYVGPPLAIHPLDFPAEIPVDVSCNPAAINGQAVMEVRGNNVLLRRTPAHHSSWQIELDHGDYDFGAQVAGPPVRAASAKVSISPPYRNVRIQVP